MFQRFSHTCLKAAAWIIALSMLFVPGFMPTNTSAHHPTAEDVPGWAFFILDLRWGNVVLEPEGLFEPATYNGSVALSGQDGVAVPTHPYNWEWGEDILHFVPPQLGQEPNPRSFTFTSVVHGSWDGLRVMVAGPKTATIRVQLNSAVFEKDLLTLATTHEKTIIALGSDQELVVRSMPLRNPRAMVTIGWGRMMGRLAAFGGELQQGAPLMLNPQTRTFGNVLGFEGIPEAYKEEYERYHQEYEEFKENFIFPEIIFRESVNFSGSFTAPGGTLRRAKPISFESEDQIISKTDSSVSWASHITGKVIGESICPVPLFSYPMITQPTFIPPPCPIYHMDRDGMVVALNLALLTGNSPLTLTFQNEDVSYTKTVTVKELFTHPIFNPVLVNGQESGYGVFMAIHHIPDKKLLRMHGRPEVFMVEDGARKHIPHPEVFLKHGFEWDDIEEVTEDELEAIAEDDEALLFPDGEIVQSEGQPEVWAIDDGQRRHIPSPDAFQDLGLKWEHIRRIPTEVLESHPVGPPADVPRPGAAPPPDGLLFKTADDPRVFRIEDGARYHVPSPEAFQMHRLDWEKVAELAPNHPFAGLLEKGELPPPDGTLIRPENAPTVYQYEGGLARPIDDLEDFQENGFAFEDVHVLPPEQVGMLPQGGQFIFGVQDVTARTPFAGPSLFQQ